MKPWIGVDFDGTLAMYDGWKGPNHLGEPVPVMLKRVKQWLAEGKDVRIFTARISHDGSVRRMLEASISKDAIESWCEHYIGAILPITNVKDYGMVELWDDRAVQVIPNTGLRADTANTETQFSHGYAEGYQNGLNDAAASK